MVFSSSVFTSKSEEEIEYIIIVDNIEIDIKYYELELNSMISKYEGIKGNKNINIEAKNVALNFLLS